MSNFIAPYFKAVYAVYESFFFFLSMFLFLVPINPVESRPGYRSHVPVIIKSIQAAS